MDYVKRARDVMDMEIRGLRKARNGLRDSFRQAVVLILDCLRQGKKIVVSGIGKNLHIAQKISATLASTGSTSVFLNPSQAVHGDLGILCTGDVLLAISYSGESEELIGILPMVKRSGVRIISIMGNANSALARSSDVAILAAVEREACPFNLAPTASTTAALAVGDALAMVLLDAQGFKRDDYARLHPGGSIGRALLLRVCDIMRTGNRLPCFSRKAKVKDVVLAMTRARSGCAAVIDRKRKLLGIFTDGDLRRHLGEMVDLLHVPVEKAMTRSPVTVRNDQLAVDVLRIFEKHKIDDLLVVDKNDRVVGSIDIQDLPKFKIL